MAFNSLYPNKSKNHSQLNKSNNNQPICYGSLVILTTLTNPHTLNPIPRTLKKVECSLD
jgi:hypothetical protein